MKKFSERWLERSLTDAEIATLAPSQREAYLTEANKLNDRFIIKEVYHECC